MDGLDPRWGTRTATHEPALLAGFRPRPSDVLITTAPKCGTTWMQQILSQLRGGDDDGVISEAVPWLESPDPAGVAAQLARYEAMADPRMFKTHCTPAQTPGIDVVRLVMTSRDPRDACVSMFHHKRDMVDTAVHGVPASLDAHVEQWLAFGGWYRNVAGWWAERHRPNLLWLRYEDLVADLPSAVDRIAGFLDVPMTAEVRARVLERSSFAWMRDHRERFTRRRRDAAPSFKPEGFIRKGEVTRGADLSPAAAAAIVERARRELDPECLAFLGVG
jgi:hypothetical protein